MMALALLFPIHFVFLRKVAIGVAYWVTALAVGWLVLFVPHNYLVVYKSIPSQGMGDPIQ